jgi:signal transduction histidine kinase
MNEITREQDNVAAITKEYINALATSSETLARHTYVLSAILDSMGAGVIVFDKDGNVILTNKRMVALAGRDLMHLTRNEVDSLYTFAKDEGETPLTPAEMPFQTAFLQKKPASVEGLTFGASLPPEGVWFSSIAAPIIGADGEFIGVVSVLQDNTHRKRLERQRDALAALIAHDTKNHLAGWDIMFALLRMEPELLDKQQLDVLSSLKTGNEAFLELCSTLLELYRANFYVLDSCRTQIDVNEILHAAVALNSSGAQAAGVALDLQVKGKLPAIQGIPAAIRQGLHNLIQNSVEASPPGTTVEISATSNKDLVTIEVRDHGKGMTAEQVAKIFDQSRVAASLPKATRSTGFGLYLTRMLIESHGGKISCTSKVRKGSTFKIELPIKASRHVGWSASAPDDIG